jgi:hypothetical protein
MKLVPFGKRLDREVVSVDLTLLYSLPPRFVKKSGQTLFL